MTISILKSSAIDSVKSENDIMLAREPSIKSPRVFTWDLLSKDGQEIVTKIQLVSDESIIGCHVIDCLSQRRGILDIKSYFHGIATCFTLEEKFAFIAERTPVLYEDDIIVFRVDVIFKTIVHGSKELVLGKGKHDLYWELFDPATANIETWSYAINDNPNVQEYLKKCPEDIQELYLNFNSQSLKNRLTTLPPSQLELQLFTRSAMLRIIPLDLRIAYLKNFEIDRYDFIGNAKTILNVKLKNKSEKSVMDETVTLTYDSWAITMVSTGVSKKNNFATWLGHAKIITEGIDNGNYYFNISDIIGENAQTLVRSHDFSSQNEVKVFLSKLSIRGQTKTWSKHTFFVKAMLKRIKWEVDQQVKALNLPFNIFGANSFLNPLQEIEGINWDKKQEKCIDPNQPTVPSITRAHNCTSWAKEKLAIATIDLESSFDNSFIDGPIYYTNRKSKKSYYTEEKRSCIII